jgi:hypothetical protein
MSDSRFGLLPSQMTKEELAARHDLWRAVDGQIEDLRLCIQEYQVMPEGSLRERLLNQCRRTLYWGDMSLSEYMRRNADV